jgi:hypothetical protein
MERIKLLDCQAKSINTYKNTKTKLLKCCANIYFNKKCFKNRIIPKYPQIKLSHTSPALLSTQLKTQTIRIRDEIRFLYQKKNNNWTAICYNFIRFIVDNGMEGIKIKSLLQSTPTCFDIYKSSSGSLSHIRWSYNIGKFTKSIKLIS